MIIIPTNMTMYIIIHRLFLRIKSLNNIEKQKNNFPKLPQTTTVFVNTP